jgi:hypothetical protein
VLAARSAPPPPSARRTALRLVVGPGRAAAIGAAACAVRAGVRAATALATTSDREGRIA